MAEREGGRAVTPTKHLVQTKNGNWFEVIDPSAYIPPNGKPYFRVKSLDPSPFTRYRTQLALEDIVARVVRAL